MAEKTTADAPSARFAYGLAYDTLHGEVILFGGRDSSPTYYSDLWGWDGTNWTRKNFTLGPPARQRPAMTYHPSLGRIVLNGGDFAGAVLSDTWTWDGTNWAHISGGTQVIDMTSRPNGVWNFTTIDIPARVTLKFKKNAAKTPVRWLATSNVVISGVLDLSGESGAPAGANATPAAGGPGGFAGGLGGIPFNIAGSSAGTPGQGPGGGLPGVNNSASGGHALHASVYGNPYIQPLVGGSGGGGGGSDSSRYGGNGGGGGGAILISSSSDILVNGEIYANGREGSTGASIGGHGSGGAIRLQADRITINGSLQALGGNLAPEQNGRVRLEAFYLTVNRATLPAHVPAAPTLTREFDTSTNLLLITSVAGQNVVQPPRGDLLKPDVIFSEAGSISVTVRSTNIPDGSLARLRVTTSGVVLTPSAIPLTNGLATFTMTVPRGHGTLQAFADLTLTSP